MRTASVAFKSHLAGEATTLCTIWKVTRGDGEIFGFTDHDQNITYDGLAYEAAASGSVSAFVTGSDLAVDNAEVGGFFDSDGIVEADLINGVWDFAEVRASLINWSDTTQGVLKTRRGWLGEVRINRGEFVVELRGLMQKLQQQVGRIYSPLCDADLGDARCGIDLDTFPDGRITTTVTSAASRRVFTATGLITSAGSPSASIPLDWFAGGIIEWLSGDNIGLSMEIKTSSSGNITLHLPMPHAIAAGDSIRATVGCNKRRTEDCFTKFANVINFRGFPDVPGMDRVLAGK